MAQSLPNLLLAKREENSLSIELVTERAVLPQGPEQ